MEDKDSLKEIAQLLNMAKYGLGLALLNQIRLKYLFSEFKKLSPESSDLRVLDSGFKEEANNVFSSMFPGNEIKFK